MEPQRHLAFAEGIRQALTEAQGGADLQMWLSHYEPMPPEPEKAA